MNEDEQDNIAIESPISSLKNNVLLSKDEDESSEGQHNWSTEIETNLKNIAINCSQQCEVSKKNYIDLLEKQKFFSIPIIVISALNSIFAVGLGMYINQQSVSVVNCIMSFFVSVIQSIALYLNISKRIDTNITCYRNYYLLSVKINNILNLKRNQRQENDAFAFLNECLAEYEAIFNIMNVTTDKINDMLIELNEIKINKDTL